MKTIQVDEDIYEHLVKNVRILGEDASSILRRLLGLQSCVTRSQTSLTAQTRSSLPNPKSTSEVDECIQNPRFQMEREAVGKFLLALSWLHKKHKEDFKKVLQIQGRSRQYFAESAGTLEEKGSSVNPQRIPDSSYWVVTNNDTAKKQRMLADVMRLLGYSYSDANRLVDAIG